MFACSEFDSEKKFDFQYFVRGDTPFTVIAESGLARLALAHRIDNALAFDDGVYAVDGRQFQCDFCS